MNNILPQNRDLPVTRLDLLRELSLSLTQSQVALLTNDLAKFESQMVRQAELCCELRRMRDSSAASSEETIRAETSLQEQARVYAAAVRRVRRTVEIFCRVLASSGVTYAGPGAAP